MLITQSQQHKMLANLKPGDRVATFPLEYRIQFLSSDLGVGGSTLIESTVLHVHKLTEGWHQVETHEFGVLKPHDPTYKYAIV